LKEKIILTALKHFARRGYENTTMNDIAKDLQITKPALYYYFKSKKELYNEIFKYFFAQIEFKNQNDMEKNIKHYISVMSSLFSNPDIAKIFAKELACEGEHLNEDTLKIMSKTIKFLQESIPESINPFFVQTMIVSAFTIYRNTLGLRKKVSNITKIPPEFDITKEITLTILSYIKEHS